MAITRIHLINQTNFQSSMRDNYQAYAKAVSVSNIANLSSVTLATAFDNATLVEGDVVLVAGQTTKTANGLYTVGAITTGVAAVTRVNATGANVAVGSKVTILDGDTYSAQDFILSGIDNATAGYVTIGTDQIEFERQSGLGMVTAGNGISMTVDDEITVIANPASEVIAIDGNGLMFDIEAFATAHTLTNQSFTETPNGVLTTFTFNTKVIESTLKVLFNGQRLDGGIGADFNSPRNTWDFRIDATANTIILNMTGADIPVATDKLRYDALMTL